MKTNWLYKLRFTSPLHIASGGLDYERVDPQIHSDTLYSAICTVAAKVFDANTLNEVFLNIETAGIKNSSSFPYVGAELFLPKPLHYHPSAYKEWDYKDQKKWKKLNFLKWNDFFDIVQGKELTAQAINLPSWSEQREVPRVTLDRVNNSPILYFYADLVFEPSAGLYFLAQFQDDSCKNCFDIALNILGDTGIGGDRNVGKGLFELERTYRIDLPNQADSSTHIMLSLFTPQPAELAHLQVQNSYYQLLIRQGWVDAKGLRRRSVRTFTEGSVLDFSQNWQPQGCFEEVLADHYGLGHSIYRNLRAFSLPIKMSRHA